MQKAHVSEEWMNLCHIRLLLESHLREVAHPTNLPRSVEIGSVQGGMAVYTHPTNLKLKAAYVIIQQACVEVRKCLLLLFLKHFIFSF